MRIRSCLVLLLALNMPALLSAQQPPPGPGHFSYNTMSYNGQQTNSVRKGWYLYWPAEALKQPRLPMPYPWWPAQAAAPQNPPPGPGAPLGGNPPAPPATPPSPLHLPRDTQSLPALPGPMSWAPPNAMPFQPVSYPYPAPSYWYGR